jgi:DNA adenine methylase
MTPKRPIIRYHGGKWKLADWIISHFPQHRIYVEPYGGAASVLIKKPRSYAEVYNDLDGEVVSLFRVVRDNGEELLRRLELTPFSRDEFVMAYEPDGCPIEQARRTVIRAFMGFGSSAVTKTRKSTTRFNSPNTGFRANSNRSGTTPARDWVTYPKNLPALIERLQGVVIENRDAKQVMMSHDGIETLHYVDPPYVAESRDKGSDYKFEMTEQDHRDLAEFLKSLKGMVVLSGYPSVLYDELYNGWKQIKISALADGAKKRTEVLFISPNVRTCLFTQITATNDTQGSK